MKQDTLGTGAVARLTDPAVDFNPWCVAMSWLVMSTVVLLVMAVAFLAHAWCGPHDFAPKSSVGDGCGPGVGFGDVVVVVGYVAMVWLFVAAPLYEVLYCTSQAFGADRQFGLRTLCAIAIMAFYVAAVGMFSDPDSSLTLWYILSVLGMCAAQGLWLIAIVSEFEMYLPRKRCWESI